MEQLIKWFSRNHVAANFLMGIVVILGVMTWGTLKTEIFPETAIDTISVTVVFPNATPEEVEKGICVPIEEAIQDVDGIERITSVASQGLGTVNIEVSTGYETRNVMDDVKTRVDAIQNLAEEAEEPILEELVIKAQVLSVAVSADTDERTLRKISERVRDQLLAYEMPEPERPFPLNILNALLNRPPAKVTQAEIAGARDYEISIEISEDTLREYGMTFDQVSRAVRASSLDLPGGSVKTKAGEILIRTEQRRYSAPEFGKITVVTREDGSRVLLRDIANIIDGFEDKDLISRFDNRPAMLINVYRVGNQDTLRVAEATKAFLREEAPRILPGGANVEIWRDDSIYLDGRMKLLKKNGFFGLLLVFLVLALFLRPSLALLVSIGIPVSFAGAILMMPYTGISLNMISLFAFILVLGIVVDDAIVVGENVYRRIREGEHPKLAAPRGTHEVGVVVIFGVLTTAFAFTPMLGLSGVSGKIWPNIPLIVIPTLMFSLVQSKLILPAHLSMLKPYDPEAKVGPILRFQRVFSRGLERFVEKFYRPALDVCLKNRYVTLSAFFSLLVVVMALMGTGWVKFEFFPDVEADVVSAKVTMAAGVPFESTERAVTQIEEAANRIAREYKTKNGESIVRHMLTSVGTQPFQTGNNVGGPPVETHLGEVTLELQPAQGRNLTGAEISSIWREEAGDIPGVVELTFQAQAAGGGNAIDLEITGDNLERLEIAASEVKEALANYEGVIDISSSNRDGKRELKLDILPSAEALGLRLEDVARQTRQGFYGEEIQRLQRGRDEVKVFVRYPEEERTSLSNIDNMKIRTASGAEVPFDEVATASYGRSYASIHRADRRRAVIITADIDKSTGANANQVVAALTREASDPGPLQKKIAEKAGQDAVPDEDGVLTRIDKQYPGVTYKFQGEQKDQAESVTEMGQKFLLALMAMYVLMAIPLKSYLQPAIIMSVIPFGLVGAVLGHVFMGLEMSIMSMCGIVALAGVVVNDSLVLVDYVNRKLQEGHDVVDAAREAGVARFRPILLTSMTTFAGLTPMLLETDIQGRFLIPMAVSLAFGVLFATAITLILIPAVYLILHDITGHAHKRPGEVDEAELEAASAPVESA